jgi:aminopeptidase N
MKRNSFIYLLTAVLGFTIYSCGSSKDKKNAYKENETSTSIFPQVLPSEKIKIHSEIKNYHAANTIYTDLIHTKLEVSFDWNNSWMYGKANITGTPRFYASDSLFLDAKGMEIKNVKLDNKLLNYKYSNDKLRIKLDKIYYRNEQFTVVIDYIAKPDERSTSGSLAITSDKGLYFINPKGEDTDKMPQIWTQGETESNSVWFPTIDSPNSKTSQEIFITVEDKYVTLSNGKMIDSKKNPDGTRTDHWKQDLPHAPYLFMMGIGEFKIVKDSYRRSDGSLMEVNYYVEPEWEKYAKAIFGETPSMIKFFSELTGVEYPWDKYHQIVVRDYVSGAMENTGAVIFGDFAYKTDRELVDENDQSTIAHELFHHWFGDLVTCESWSNLPLNESFANYSQYLWDEYRYGIDVADYNAIGEMQGYFQSAESSGHHNLIWFDYENKEQMFDAHSYNKGGRILHMLRNYLGDEAFFQGIQTYLNDNKFQPAEFHHLRLAFENVCGEDLNWFFNQWFLASGHPILLVENYYSENNNELILTVTQNQDLDVFPIFKLPVEIAIHDDKGVTIHKATIDKQENKIVLPVSGKLKTYIFDNQQMLLAEITEKKTQEQYIHQYYFGERYKARVEGLENGTLDDNLESQKMILDALKDPFWEIRYIAIEKSAILSENNKSKALEEIQKMVFEDANPYTRTSALSLLVTELSPEKAEEMLVKVIANDLSYTVLSVALGSLSSINQNLAMTKAKELESEPSTKMKSGIAQIYSVKGGEEHYPFFEDLFFKSKLSGYDGIYSLNALTIFMTRQNIDIQSKAVDFYRHTFEKGGFYAKMFLPQNVEYLRKHIKENIKNLNEDLSLNKKNKEDNAVQEIQLQISKHEKVENDLMSLLQEIEKNKK